MTSSSLSSGEGRKGRLTPYRLDRLEQVVILALWCLLLRRLLEADNPLAPLVLVAETTVVLFVLIRRPSSAISVRLGDWLLAATATAAPLLIVPTATPLPQLVLPGLALIILGNCFQIWAKLFLRRSFGIAPANRGVKQSGPYRFVRHPMYAGYLAVHIGIMLLMPSLVNLLLYGIGWSAQILRLQAEERLLGQDPTYQDYMRNVRWRLIPGVF